MPLSPYIRPQDTLTQNLRNSSASTIGRRNAIVVGPQYKLALNDGRELAKHEFNSGGFYNNNNGSALKYEVASAGVVTPLDLTAFTPLASSVKVFAEDLRAQVFGSENFVVVPGTRNSLRTSDTLSAGIDMLTDLNGRPVQVGDIFRVTDNTTETTTERKVVALLPTLTPSVIGTPTDSNGAPVALASSGTYTGDVIRQLVVEVVTGGDENATVLKVHDSAGVYPTLTVGPTQGTAPFVVGEGVSLQLSDTTYTAGSLFYVSLTPAMPQIGSYNGVVLDGNVVTSAYNPAYGVYVEGFVSFTGEITSGNVNGNGTAYTVQADPADGVVVEEDLGLPSSVTGHDNFIYFDDAIGKIFLSYKAAAIPAATEGPFTIASASEITSKLGEIDEENWLARGAFEALNGAAGNSIYVLRTGGDTVEDFSAALLKLRSSDLYYAIAPMTDQLEVMQLVKAHCEEMSNKVNMNFRRCYVGCDSPGAYLKWSFLSDNTLRQAVLANNRLTLLEAYRADSSFLTDASVGDTLTITGLGAPLTITAILSAYEVEVNSEATILQGGITLTCQDNAANTVSFVSQRSAALNSRRCVNVWSENATYGGSNILPMKFVAAEIAGIRSALIPQRGLTMTELSSVTAAPAMYTKFTQEQLDTIASFGTLIVTQESANGSVFIRHQLTTDVVDGALAYEDNVGVIVDTFSQSVKDKFRSYRGRRNVTPNTIEDIRVQLKQLAIDATQTTLVDADYGPMVIRFFDETGRENEVTVRVDGDLADHIATYVRLRVPLPLNGINHYVDVETSVNL